MKLFFKTLTVGLQFLAGATPFTAKKRPALWYTEPAAKRLYFWRLKWPESEGNG